MTAYSLMFCVLFRKNETENQNIWNQDQSIYVTEPDDFYLSIC